MQELLPIAGIAALTAFFIGFVYGYEKGRKEKLAAKPKTKFVSIEGKKIELHEN